MNATAESLIHKTVNSLRLSDIILYEARFGRAEQPSSGNMTQGFQQHKRGVKYTVVEPDGGESARQLHILVMLGTRVTAGTEDEPDPPILFFIEADFVVIYDIVGELEDDGMKAFAELNAVHNAWPFWRQHVFDIVQRARLPQLDIPLFSGGKA